MEVATEVEIATVLEDMAAVEAEEATTVSALVDTTAMDRD